jgi:c-di-GMP-binding flagellar brake protein YcgR
VVPGVGEVLRMTVRTIDEAESKIVYKSRILDLKETGFVIEFPIAEAAGKTRSFQPGLDLSVWFFGKDGSKYSFPAAVLAREAKPMLSLIISIPKEDQIQRMQRRNYVRLPADLDIAMRAVYRDEIRFVTKTVDISGGGLAVICKKNNRIREGEAFSCWVVLPLRKGLDYIPFHGRVVRIKPLSDEAHAPLLVSLVFTEIKEVERDKIIRYCFERELELHKKGIF